MGKMVLNPDKQAVKQVREGLKMRNGYCPCLVLMNEDTKCPCKDFREDKKCHCGLYVEEV